MAHIKAVRCNYTPAGTTSGACHALCLTNVFLFQSSGSDLDLIKLDDTPNELEEFDPLMCRDRGHKAEPIKTSADSALLHEYGLDFSRFGLLDMPPSCSEQPDNTNVHKNWTTFN